PNLKISFCYFSPHKSLLLQEGSMDSLYEPVPEQHANQGSTSVGTGSLISPHGESGKAHANLFMEVSNFENAKPKKKKIANDTTWQEPSKPENDSHIRRLSQLKDLNEEDFLLSNYMHTFQGKKPQGISCQQRHVKPGHLVKNFSPNHTI
uniref:Uncharacterized protein n=1 Tax=Panthera tigris altaica TaxID=74533 RepID=A0A8C9JSM3_PANTA